MRSRRAKRIVALLELVEPNSVHGYDICKITGIKPSSLYPLLIRLEQEGTVVATTMPYDPPRVYYSLNRAHAGADQ